MSCRIFRSAQETEFEALQAAPSPFWLVLLTFDCLQPGVVIIIRIYNLQSKSLGISGAFVLAYLVLLARIDVRIAVIYDRSHSMLHETLDDGT